MLQDPGTSSRQGFRVLICILLAAQANRTSMRPAIWLYGTEGGPEASRKVRALQRPSLGGFSSGQSQRAQPTAGPNYFQ